MLDVFIVVDSSVRGDVSEGLSALRAAGLAADIDYAGRSLKGQLRHAERHSRHVVVVDRGVWTLRKPGEPDREIDPGRLIEELA